MAKYEQTVADALASLVEKPQFSSQNSGNIEEDYAATQWNCQQPIPSLEEVKAEIKRIADGNPTDASGRIKYAYRELRSTEYPAIGDQLDDLYHSGAFSEEMSAKIQAIKQKYPKPE